MSEEVEKGIGREAGIDKLMQDLQNTSGTVKEFVTLIATNNDRKLADIDPETINRIAKLQQEDPDVKRYLFMRLQRQLI